MNARFVGADFAVSIVICGRTNFIVCNFVRIASKKRKGTGYKRILLCIYFKSGPKYFTQ